LKDYREDGTIEASQYRKYYLKAKGGSYRSIAHMRSQMTLEGITLKGGDE
jgi:ribosomal protein L19E